MNKLLIALCLLLGVATVGHADTCTQALSGGSLVSSDVNAICDGLAEGALAPLFADGTGTLPSITFASDPTSGMYLSGANTISFSTGGAKRISLGTNALTPASAGSISLGTSSLPYIQSYTGNDTIKGVSTYSAGNSSVVIGAISAHDLEFRTNNARKWYIENADGDIKSDVTSAGVILKSPDGTCSKCTVNNSDVFSCASITC